jgi:hypothetical protein
MAEKADMQEPHGLAAKLRDVGGAAQDMSHAALRETLSWSTYQWTVLALLTAIFLLVALSYGGIRAELAALKQNAGGAGQDRAAIEAELGRQVSDVKSGLDQALADMKSALTADLAAIGAKLDALRPAPKQAAPAQKPPAKPRPQ